MTAARIAIDKLNSGVASLKRRQRYEPSGDLVKVNLGSGLAIAPGWINIDMNASTLCAPLPAPALRLVYHLSSARRWANADEYVQKLKGNILVHHNLVYGIPLTDESADYVYSAHFFEHLYREDAERLFREAHRILKPDGVFRINVPSLEPWVAALAAGDTETGPRGVLPTLLPGRQERHSDATATCTTSISSGSSSRTPALPPSTNESGGRGRCPT